MNKFAVIRVRGKTGIKRGIKRTLDILRLYNKNHLIILNESSTIPGMMQKIKDYVTWGEISQETFKELVKKRGRLPGNILLTDNYLKEKTHLGFDEFTKEFFQDKKSLSEIPGLKTFFRLKPPIGGFENQGV